MKWLFFILAFCACRNETRVENRKVEVADSLEYEESVPEEKVNFTIQDKSIVYEEIANSEKKEVNSDMKVPESWHFKSSENQMEAGLFDVCLEDFSQSECDDSGHSEGSGYATEIYKVSESDDYLKILVRTSANCCYGFIGDIGLKNDSVLKVIFYAHGENFCACSCGYELTYLLKKNCTLKENRADWIYGISINNRDEVYRLIRTSL